MRILFLTHRLPYAPNRGDRIRAYHMLQLMAAHGEVDVVSLVHDAAEEAHAGDLAAVARVHSARVSALRNYVHGVGTLATRRPLTHALLDSGAMRRILDRIVAERPPDVVLAYCSGMARFALEPPLRGIPFVLDMMDVDSAKWSALAQSAAAPRRWIYRREAACLGGFEVKAVRHAVVTFVVNDKERSLLARMAPGADIVVLPNGIDVDAFRPPGPPAAAPRVVFCGVMNYEPNVAAALWMAHEVWPMVRGRRPDARLVLVGSDPVPDVAKLPADDPTIEVTGTVPDVRPFLWGAAVGVAPLLTARGIQNKVLEALAAGLPTVVTPAVADGLPPEALKASVTASTPGAFAEAVASLLQQTAGERRAIAEQADLHHLAWPQQLAPLIPALERAARAGAHLSAGAGHDLPLQS